MTECLLLQCWFKILLLQSSHNNVWGIARNIFRTTAFEVVGDFMGMLEIVQNIKRTWIKCMDLESGIRQKNEAGESITVEKTSI